MLTFYRADTIFFETETSHRSFTFSACLALTIAQKNRRFNQKTTTTPPPSNDNEFFDDRRCDEMNLAAGSEVDPWACLCHQFQFQRETCESDIEKYLPSQPGSKVCKDHRHYYIGLDNRCNYDRALDSSNDPAGKAMQFALDLFRVADNKNPEENFIISPLSPQVLLAQLTEGCSEKARMEMVNGVKLNGNEAASLVDALTAASNKDSTANKLDIASVFFKSKDIKLQTEFRDDAKQNNMKMKDIDFSNPQQAANAVNEWASTQTRGNIPQVITERKDQLFLMIIRYISYIFFSYRGNRPGHDDAVDERCLLQGYLVV